MAPHDRRIAMLMEWRKQVLAAGYDVPSVVDLVAIGTSPSPWPADVDVVAVAPWKATIQFLLKQMSMGVSDPIDQLPSKLRAPQQEAGSGAQPPPPAPPVPGGTRPGSSPREASPQFEALKQWAAAGMERNPKAFSEVKDHHLRNVLRSGQRSAEGIAKILPPSIKEFAGEVAALLSGASSTAAPGAERTQPPSPRPPVTEAVPSARPGIEPVPPSSASSGASLASGGGAAPSGPPAFTGASANEPRPGVAGDPAEPAAHEFDPTDFADFDGYSEPDGEPGPLKHVSGRSAAVTLSWGAPEEPAPVTIYRVVSGDDFPPYAPELADLVAVTTACRCADARPFASAVRHLQVWRNDGDDVVGALEAQPRLHAAASVVSPVADLDIREDQGRVIGQWRVFPGVRRVQVYRVPIERARQSGATPAEYRILAGEDNLGGFVDASPERGRCYRYHALAEAEVDGVARLSVPRGVDVCVSAVLEGVTDLEVAPHGSEDDPQFDLTWTNPTAGRVVVFRTQGGPRAGADAESRPESVLPQMGLDPVDRLAYPIAAAPDGRVSMRNVPWPSEWTRTYFTPVTILDGVAVVGRTTSATLIPPVREVVIVERVHRQVVTFAWPQGAASVLAYVGPAAQSAEQARGGRPHEISADKYRELGGMRLPNQLPAAGCAVHMVPVAFAGGERIEGDPVTVPYPGLLRLSYRIAMKRGITGRPTSLSIAITSEVPVPGAPPFVSAPPFVLVHNPERLPLDVTDGTPIEVMRDGDETLARTRRFVPSRLSPDEEPSVWKADVKDRTGFVRLLVDLPPEVMRLVALMDPPARQLRLEPLFGGR